MAGFDSLEWTALFMPPATPQPVVDRFNAALRKVLATPDIQERLTKLGMESHPSTSEELGALVASDLAVWGPIVKSSGFTVD